MFGQSLTTRMRIYWKNQSTDIQILILYVCLCVYVPRFSSSYQLWQTSILRDCSAQTCRMPAMDSINPCFTSWHPAKLIVLFFSIYTEPILYSEHNS
uniref:Uncharacterized protein n=1 Tax=Pyxicephalus adspersus TaxID=30357 RepID=A0AAV3B9F2_PYXAD|nr:TPA: hypothetical protein GDO54_001159 [Pyxicephalus adspersus]